MGQCAYRTNARSQVAYSSGANCDLWRVTSGSSQVPTCLCNLSTCSIKIPAKTVVGQVMPANQVPLVVHPIGTSEESKNNPQKGWVLEALDLQGLGKWPKPEQEQARKLLLKWECLFAHLDLGKTALIKHKIEVTDWMPFKEHH